jgi:hypothetical protein
MPKRSRKKKSAAPRHRDAQVTVIFGKNGTGKSYLCRQIIEAMGGRAVVVTYAGMPKIWREVPEIDAADPAAWQWEQGMRQIIAARYETKGTRTDVFKHLYRHFRGGAIVFDDCREYIVGNRLTDYPYLKKLLSAFRHMELDR